MIWGLELRTITAAHILSLVENRVSEGDHLEYKRDLPAGEDARRLLTDVTAFANAGGGDIIFGLDEARDSAGRPTGRPCGVAGIGGENLDQWKLRIMSWLRDSVKPPLGGVAVHEVDVAPEKRVLLVRVFRSYAAPHAIGSETAWAVYVRSGSGNRPLPIPEVRAAFLRSENFAESLRRFRMTRMAAVVSGQTPAPLPSGAVFLLHVVPFTAFDLEQPLNISRLQERREHLMPFGSGIGSSWFNASGFVTASSSRDDKQTAIYLQVFRNGVLEHAWGVSERGLPDSERRIIPGQAFERYIVKAVGQSLAFLRAESIGAPFAILLTLLRARGYAMATGRNDWHSQSHEIHEEDVIGPEIVCDGFDVEVPALLKPALDVIWNATGWAESHNFDESGTWTLGKRS